LGVVVGARCSILEHGTRLLIRWLDTGDDATARELLAGPNGWALRIVHEALSADDTDILGFAFSIALEILSDDSLLTEGLLLCVAQDHSAEAANRLVARLAPTLTRSFAQGPFSDREAQLFDAPAWQRWTRDQGTDGVTRVLDSSVWRAGLRQGWSAFGSIGARTETRLAAARILTVCIRQADSRAFDQALEPATSCVRQDPQDLAIEKLAAEVLVALRYRMPGSATAWLELVFQIAYEPLVNNRHNPFEDTPWRGGTGEWDLARNWREWLVLTWFERRWPPAGFLRTLGADHGLLDGCCEVLRYRYGRLDFVDALIEAASRERSLAEWEPHLRLWRAEFKIF
jgi:hypothetical protein